VTWDVQLVGQQSVIAEIGKSILNEKGLCNPEHHGVGDASCSA